MKSGVVRECFGVLLLEQKSQKYFFKITSDYPARLSGHLNYWESKSNFLESQANIFDVRLIILEMVSSRMTLKLLFVTI